MDEAFILMDYLLLLMDKVFILMDFLFIQVPLLPRQMHEAQMKLPQALVYPQIFQILLHFYAPSLT
jgi:hypothetical protein